MAKNTGGESRPSLFSRIGLNLRKLADTFLQPLDLNIGGTEPEFEEEPEEPEFEPEFETEDDLLERVGIKERRGYTVGELDRGPYYGKDQFMDKLRGMRSAWGYIDGITVVRTGGIDRYYLRVDDRQYWQSVGRNRY